MIELMNWNVEQMADFQKAWAFVLAFFTFYNIVTAVMIYGKNRSKIKNALKWAIAQGQEALNTVLKIVEAIQYKRFARQRIKEEMALKRLPAVTEEVPEVIQPKPQAKSKKKAKKRVQKPARLTIHHELQSNPEFQHLLEAHTLVQLRKMAKDNNIRVYNVHGNGKHLNKAEIAALLVTV